MRVTQNMINRTVLKSMEDSKNRLNAVQNRISTGKDIENPSDDPVKFTRAVSYKNDIINNREYIDNITNGVAWMQTSYGIMDEMYELVVDARDRALQGADDISSSTQRSAIGDEIDAILESVISLANTSSQNKYIFAGTETVGNKPFSTDEDGNVTYNGNSEAITRRVYENYDVTINVAGDEIADTGIFENLLILRDALNENDVDNITQSITNLGDTSGKLLSSIAQISSIKNQADMTQARLEMANINLSSYISQTEDTDMAEAIAQYGIEEMAYKAALQTTSNAINLNILDYLR